MATGAHAVHRCLCAVIDLRLVFIVIYVPRRLIRGPDKILWVRVLSVPFQDLVGGLDGEILRVCHGRVWQKNAHPVFVIKRIQIQRTPVFIKVHVFDIPTCPLFAIMFPVDLVDSDALQNPGLFFIRALIDLKVIGGHKLRR